MPEKHGFDLFFGYYDQVHAHTYFPKYLIRNSQEVVLPGNDDFTVKRPIDEAHRLPAIGQPVELAWAPEHCRAFAREEGDVRT